ncbi:GNAT family N-acetyltransferase [Ferrovibrio sp.]|uniref:GNAT family N-acetyltransferase n=1 Tax=Ferrovibrio sp. TaxID=1917215 RepID=UPI003D279830
MANTEAIGSMKMQPWHLPGALALSAEAGWNQVAPDWLLMIEHGHAIGVEAGDDGALVASALALPFGARLAWISMVLVTASHRRRGLASKLVSDCLAWLEQRGCVAVLDATAAGAEVYRPLGFETVRRITRWQHPGQAISAATPQPALGEQDLAWVLPLDEAVFGAERDFVLADLLRRPKAVALGLPSRNGFALSRDGRVATQIGPVVAPQADEAMALLDAMLARIHGPVFIDAYDDQAAFAAHLEKLGFRRQRGFERMVRGQIESFGDMARSFAAAGPELG